MSTYTGIDFDRYAGRVDRIAADAETVTGATSYAEIRRDGAAFAVTFPHLAPPPAPGGRFTEYHDAFAYAVVVVDAVGTPHAEDPAYVEDFRQFASLWTADELATARRALADARTSEGSPLPVLDVLTAL